MEHDFKKALNWLHNVEGSIHEPCQYKETIQFALRFTQAALSGEVSESMHEVYHKNALPDAEIDFKNMTTQLMKEVEDDTTND